MSLGVGRFPGGCPLRRTFLKGEMFLGGGHPWGGENVSGWGRMSLAEVLPDTAHSFLSPHFGLQMASILCISLDPFLRQDSVWFMNHYVKPVRSSNRFS